MIFRPSWPTTRRPPLPAQKRFLESTSPFICYIGGVGSGKTKVLTDAVYYLLLRYPGIRGVIGRYQRRDFELTTMRTLWSQGPNDPVGTIPKEFLDVRGSVPHKGYFRFINGSELIYAHYDEEEQFQSGEYGFFAIDEITELPNDTVWNILGSRLRQILPDGTVPKYHGLGAGNPNGHDWVWSKFHPDSPNKLSDCHLITPAPMENKENLPKDYYERLVRSNGYDWVQRYIMGSFDVFEKQIWKEWDEKIHVIEPFPIPPKWLRACALDEGMSAPTAACWGAWDKDGNLIIYRDYYRISPVVAIHALALKEASANERINDWVADPAIWDIKGTRGPNSNPYTAADEYAENGIDFIAAENSIPGGIQRVAGLLRQDPEHRFPEWHPKAGEFGSPRLFVFRTCVHIKTYVPQWKWVVPKTEESQPKPSNHNKHCADITRYLAMIRRDRPAQALDETWESRRIIPAATMRAVQKRVWSGASTRHRERLEKEAEDREREGPAREYGNEFY